MVLETYIIKHKDLNTRMASRSGGIFTAITDGIFSENGIIYGCKMVDSYSAEHSRATSIEERNTFRGSKYIQSNLKDIFKSIKQDVDFGRTVLFSGTPCQVAGLKSYLGMKIPENLYLVDIVCHGVPSPLIWRRYASWLEKIHKGKIQEVDFRNKRKNGWASHLETVKINGIEYEHGSFSKMFYTHNIMRPSCFKCPYKNLERVSDISIADAWGIQGANPEFNDNKGVSLVLINSEKGKSLFGKVKCDLDIISIDINKYMQPPLKENYPVPKTRNQFWKDFHNLPFSIFMIKYGSSGIIRKISEFKKLVKKVFLFK